MTLKYVSDIPAPREPFPSVGKMETPGRPILWMSKRSTEIASGPALHGSMRTLKRD